MTRLKVRDYEPEDFLNIEPTEKEMLYRKDQPLAQWALTKKLAGPTATVVDDEGNIVFCCGIMDFWPGVGEIWAVFSPLAQKYAHTWIVAKELLAAHLKNYVRLQAPLDPAGRPEAIRFDERLGFKPEGLMRHYGPHGEDMIMYALVKENGDA